MKKYEPQKFIDTFLRKIGKPNVPPCRFCGGNRFTSTDQVAFVVISDNLQEMKLGQNIPAGMIICEKCGHIDFFALGALGLLETKEESKDV